ncbi:hypothetical protein D918_05066 [Trichuris suis]|nr:hypothetical protein D918_05066 [Trichuris suis]
MAEMVHSFQVEMTCDGCSSQVRRVLSRLNGAVNAYQRCSAMMFDRLTIFADDNPGSIAEITFDMPSNIVNVKTKLNKDQIMGQLQKTCKPCEYVSSRPSV